MYLYKLTEIIHIWGFEAFVMVARNVFTKCHPYSLIYHSVLNNCSLYVCVYIYSYWNMEIPVELITINIFNISTSVHKQTFSELCEWHYPYYKTNKVKKYILQTNTITQISLNLEITLNLLRIFALIFQSTKRVVIIYSWVWG